MPADLRTRLRPPSQPDEIFRPQRLAIGQLDVDAGVVLRETGHLASAVDRHRQLVDPAGQDALDVVLPQPEPIGVPRREVADVQPGPANPATWADLPSERNRSAMPRWSRTSMVRECRPPAREPAKLLAGAPLDNGDVDAGQRQLAREHQPGRAATGDHHCMRTAAGHRYLRIRNPSTLICLCPLVATFTIFNV